MLFDPIPTPGHTLILVLVPLFAALLQRRIARDDGELPRLFGPAVGYLLGVTTFYGLVFLPISPLAVLGLMIGFGLFALAPVLSWFATVALWARARRRGIDTRAPLRGVFAGALFAWAALSALDLPVVLGRMAIPQGDAVSAGEIETLRERFSRAPWSA